MKRSKDSSRFELYYCDGLNLNCSELDVIRGLRYVTTMSIPFTVRLLSKSRRASCTTQGKLQSQQPEYCNEPESKETTSALKYCVPRFFCYSFYFMHVKQMKTGECVKNGRLQSRQSVWRLQNYRIL